MIVYEIRKIEELSPGEDSWIADFRNLKLATKVLNLLETDIQRRLGCEPAVNLPVYILIEAERT